MYRQMMKRKHPSSSPLLEEEEAKRMADSVALELERGIRLSPKKRPRTAPQHDPFFVGTPEEEALHMQRLEGRKRKSEDFTASAGDDEIMHQPRLAATSTGEAAPNNNRSCKIARRSRKQLSAVDIDTLNRQLSTVDLSDTTDANANPCRALALYSPDPFAHPTITSTDDLPDLNDESSGPEASLLSRYRHRFPFRIEDLSKALIIYPEEHPLQPVIDKIKDYEQRTGRSNVKVEELNSSSLDDIDDDHSARMIEEHTAYLVDEDDDEEEEVLDLEDNEEDSEYGDYGEVEDGLVKEIFPSIPPEERFEVLTDSAFLLTPSTTTTSTPFFESSTSFSSPFTTSTATTLSSPYSSSSSFSSLPPHLSASPTPFGSTSSFAPSSLFGNAAFSPSSSSSSSSAFLSAPPVFSNISPFSSSSASPFAFLS